MAICNELVKKAKAGCRVAVGKVIEEMTPAIALIVRKHFDCLDEDAMQEGAIAVMKAIKSYRFGMDTVFATYCHNAIFRELVANEDSFLYREREYRDKNQSIFGVDLSYTQDFENKIFCENLLGKLDKRSADMVRRRFGLSVPEESVANIAAKTGYTPRRVQQIIKEAIDKLSALVQKSK